MEDRIVYGGVATNEGLITFHSDFVEINPVIESLLGGIDFYVDHKRSFGSHVRTKGHTVQYIVDNEVAFISAASTNFPQRICFKFLDAVAREYHDSLLDSDQDKLLFEQWLKRQITFYSEDPTVDSLRHVKKQINDVTGVMHENIQMAIGRGEKLEGIMHSAENLESKTLNFNRLSKEVKCAALKDDMKSTLQLVIVILVVLVCIVGIIGAVVYILFY